MTATGHLELLRQMFPEKFVLGIDEIAKVLGCSKQWIYVQSSRNALPFAKLPGSRIRVTVMELARYLDASGAQPDADKVVTPIEKGTVSSDEVQLAQEQPVAKKKIGRPRKIDSVLNNRGRS
ncbi:helix-turn-helix domain-containing protein [Comamonas aquatica]|uniref:helix-turn-helix domain-containing protein n=1 Tax=Comamonas aquatica TaxID=225991 RepID=UPI00244BE6D2|nr:helix-turn-helix domain-containing protein [Comamonas aquatica]MDH1766560.1 helix-turn-helix domain-containing protein [Comamonas aquatica]